MDAADIDVHMKLISTVLANGTPLGGVKMARLKTAKPRTARDDVVDQLKMLASTHKLEDKSLELCEKSAYCAKMAANLKSLRIGLLLRFVSCVGTCRSSSSDNHITGL